MNKPTKDKLKPCPFCGSKPRFWRWNYGAIVECWCIDHRIQCEAKTLEEAVKAWNRRIGAKNEID